MVLLLARSLGICPASLVAYAIAALILRKAPPALHGLGPGFLYGLFLLAAWGNPGAEAPGLEAGANVLGSTLMYLLLSVLREPHRLRWREALVTLGTIAALLSGIGPSLEKKNFVEGSVHACRESLDRAVPGVTTEIERGFVCRCVLAPVNPECAAVVMSASSLIELQICDKKQLLRDLTQLTPEATYDLFDACEVQHLETAKVDTIRQSIIDNLILQRATAASKESKIPTDDKTKAAYLNCFFSEFAKACHSVHPGDIYRCLVNEEHFDRFDYEHAGVHCRADALSQSYREAADAR